MKKSILLFSLIFPLAAFAQDVKIHEYPRFRLGIEAGGGFLFGTTVKPAAVRENKSYYYDVYSYRDYYYSGYVNDNQTTSHYYVGVKPEFSITNSISIAAGLRFLGSNSTLNSDKNYFLWKVSENDLTTNYVRVKGVEQNNFYVGIPVEMTFYTYKRDIRVRHFVRGGVNFNILLASETTPQFENAAMKKYADKVKNDIEKKDPFSPAAFVGTGVKIGRMNSLFGTVEIRVPFTMTGFSSFAKSSVGVEFQTTICIPFGEEKLSYTYR